MWFSRSDTDPLTPWRIRVLFLKLALLYKDLRRLSGLMCSIS